MTLAGIKTTILSATHGATSKARDQSSTGCGWLDFFWDELKSDLIFPQKDLISIEHQEITDF